MTLNGRISVIGIGSPIMTDDSVGLRISEAIQRRNMPDVDCYQEAVGGLEILPLLRGYSYAIIVDAMQSGERGPGSVVIYDVADFEDAVASDVPAHDINVPTALRIGRRMEPDSMPLSVRFVAVEADDVTTVSECLTPEVAASLGSAEDAVMHVIGLFREERDRRSAEEGS